jgi:hypothetical protein
MMSGIHNMETQTEINMCRVKMIWGHFKRMPWESGMMHLQAKERGS